MEAHGTQTGQPSGHTQTGHPGGKKEFPPFQQDTFASQLLWLALIFGLLYLLMAKVALPRVGAIMEARRERIEGDLAEARRLKEEADVAIAAHEKALADARARAQTLASETRASFAADAEAARKALDATLNARVADAEQAIAATRTAAMANVQDIAVTTAAAIVERLIGQVPAGDHVSRAVADALKR
jgi:F-type H+-transporting ATPase subunit b